MTPLLVVFLEVVHIPRSQDHLVIHINEMIGAFP